jgi:hypothetical protein
MFLNNKIDSFYFVSTSTVHKIRMCVHCTQYVLQTNDDLKNPSYLTGELQLEESAPP